MVSPKGVASNCVEFCIKTHGVHKVKAIQSGLKIIFSKYYHVFVLSLFISFLANADMATWRNCQPCIQSPKNDPSIPYFSRVSDLVLAPIYKLKNGTKNEIIAGKKPHVPAFSAFEAYVTHGIKHRVGR